MVDIRYQHKHLGERMLSRVDTCFLYECRSFIALGCVMRFVETKKIVERIGPSPICLSLAMNVFWTMVKVAKAA